MIFPVAQIVRRRSAVPVAFRFRSEPFERIRFARRRRRHAEDIVTTYTLCPAVRTRFRYRPRTIDSNATDTCVI